MSRYPHVNSISIFDANKVVVKKRDDEAGQSISIVIHNEEGATTTLTVWRGHGDDREAPELVVEQ